jgi:DNA-binding response OmpR family regulator
MQPPAKVLVVSPDAHLREQIVQVMLRDGLIVDHVPREEEAFAACAEHRAPDFIVYDVARLPHPQALQRLEEACSPTPTTLVLLTSRKKRLRLGRGTTTIRVDRPRAVTDLVNLSRLIERRYGAAPTEA